MPAGLAALGTLAAKGGGMAKAGWAAMGGIEKLMLLLFGGDLAAKGLGGITGLNPYSTQKKQIELGGKQIEMQAALGKREEARTESLINKLLREKEKEYLRSEKTQTREDVRLSQERQNQMAMVMLMSLANMQSEQAETASRPSQATASMMSLMR